MNALRWVKAPQYIREFNGLRQSAQVGDALEVGVFHEKHGADRWRVLPRTAGDCWGHGIGFGTKRDAIAHAEKYFRGNE